MIGQEINLKYIEKLNRQAFLVRGKMLSPPEQPFPSTPINKIILQKRSLLLTFPNLTTPNEPQKHVSLPASVLTKSPLLLSKSDFIANLT